MVKNLFSTSAYMQYEKQVYLAPPYHGWVRYGSNPVGLKIKIHQNLRNLASINQYPPSAKNPAYEIHAFDLNTFRID